MTDLGTIEEYMNRRIFTDYIMPVWLPFIPVLLVIIGILFFTLVFIATSSNINAFDSYSYTSSYYFTYSTYHPYHSYPSSYSSAEAIDELGVVAILLLFFIMLAGSMKGGKIVFWTWFLRFSSTKTISFMIVHAYRIATPFFTSCFPLLHWAFSVFIGYTR